MSCHCCLPIPWYTCLSSEVAAQRQNSCCRQGLDKGNATHGHFQKNTGKTGEPVILTIERPGEKKPRDIVLVKERISRNTVKSFELEPGFWYIPVMNFLGSTDKDFAAALNSLAAKSCPNLKNICFRLGGRLSVQHKNSISCRQHMPRW
jgi:hypothetical protein